MVKESKNKSLLILIEEIWEEIEVQFYGITGAILFFVVVYIIFQPTWMSDLFDLFSNNKLPLG
tara:strand:- start:224 stop:412 length:189 start_codon:yes stop_codon:yes gene_type:complete